MVELAVDAEEGTINSRLSKAEIVEVSLLIDEVRNFISNYLLSASWKHSWPDETCLLNTFQ